MEIETENLIKKGFNNITVEILKELAKHFSVLDANYSCMRAEGPYGTQAFIVVQAPIFIIGIKDKISQKIIGRTLLIPVKIEAGWFIELKNTYEIGQEYTKEFIKKTNKAIGEEIIKKEYIGGEFPLTQTVIKKLDHWFWRDETKIGDNKGRKVWLKTV